MVGARGATGVTAMCGLRRGGPDSGGGEVEPWRRRGLGGAACACVCMRCSLARFAVSAAVCSVPAWVSGCMCICCVCVSGVIRPGHKNRKPKTECRNRNNRNRN
jgi:hypothetical protein